MTAPLLIALLALSGCGEDVPLKDALISMGDDVAIELATTEAAMEMPVLDVPPVEVKAPEPSGPHTVTMRSGESLALYARWIGTIPEKIAKQNKVDPYGKFRVGQKLVLDLGSSTPEQFEDKRMAWRKGRLATYLKKRGGVHKVIKHKVRKGETVLGIARRHGRLPLWVMRHYNKDRNLDRLAIGDIVRVPLTNDRVTARR
jgi:LysM repeat protein